MFKTADDLFRTLASSPRPAGSPSELTARRLCAHFLERHGFTCTEHPFKYSAWPARWGTTYIGVLLILGALGILFILHGVHILPGNLVLVPFAVIVYGLLNAAIFQRFGSLDFPFTRRAATNLEATRPGHPRPTLWLVAHLDSKSQPISMAVRVVSITATAVLWATVLILTVIIAFVTPLHTAKLHAPLTLVTTLAFITTLPLLFCTISNRSPGALDNASGVATILSAVAQLDPSINVGVLLTSAEELGLAGARAWVNDYTQTTYPTPRLIINCDSVDDTGQIVCMSPRRFHDHLRDLFRAAQAQSPHPTPPVTIRRLIPGILVDAVAFTQAGWTACTISRGTWRSLARIHSKRDNLTHMTGTGIPVTANMIARLAGAFIADKDPARTQA